MLASAPARSMNHIRANLGIPYDSISDERALGANTCAVSWHVEEEAGPAYAVSTVPLLKIAVGPGERGATIERDGGRELSGSPICEGDHGNRTANARILQLRGQREPSTCTESVRSRPIIADQVNVVVHADNSFNLTDLINRGAKVSRSSALVAPAERLALNPLHHAGHEAHKAAMANTMFGNWQTGPDGAGKLNNIMARDRHPTFAMSRR